MLSPVTQRLSSSPFTPRCKPILPREVMYETSVILEKVENNQESEVEMKPELKVVIKDFAKTNISEISSVDIETLVEEELTEDTRSVDQESDDLEFYEIEEPVSPPPSEPNEVILVEDDQDDQNDQYDQNGKTEVAKETNNNAGKMIHSN